MRAAAVSKNKSQTPSHFPTKDVLWAVGAAAAAGVAGGIAAAFAAAALVAVARKRNFIVEMGPAIILVSVVVAVSLTTLGITGYWFVNPDKDFLNDAADKAIVRVLNGETKATETYDHVKPTLFGFYDVIGTREVTVKKVGKEGTCSIVSIISPDMEPYPITVGPTRLNDKGAAMSYYDCPQPVENNNG